MLVDNRKMVASMLVDVGNMDNIEAVEIINLDGQVRQAGRNLLQLEEAARALFVDVRESILNLKMAGREGASLVETLEELKDGVLEVTVKDDGRGFDPDQAKAGQRPRFGLSSFSLPRIA